MKYLSFALLAFVLVGCGPMASDRPIPVDSAAPSAPAVAPTAPDNTRVNQRDRDPDAKTPVQQDENKRDIQITADIRKAILATEGMSLNAQNSKIITSSGKVTLRGPVASDEEKAKVEALAADVAGPENVHSELEVQE